jgi:hypothetical protein
MATTRRRIPTEHQEQVALFTWAWHNRQKYPLLRLLFAVPNGGHRNIVVAKRMRDEGQKAGVPDILLPVMRNGFGGCFIELKRKGNYPSPIQKAWMSELTEQGYAVHLCYGWEAARDVLVAYLEGEK